MGKSDVLDEKHELIIKNNPSLCDEDEQKKAFHSDNRLNFVSIQNSELSVLYNYVGNCNELTRLVLSFNQLKMLPDIFGELTNLTFVDVSNNELSGLPKSLSKLEKLQSLIVTQNQITNEGLNEMTPMSSLLVADFSHNKLTKVPLCLCLPGFVKLHTVNISHNEISEVPEEFEIPQIKDLNLSNNTLVESPGVLAKYPKIKSLDLSGNSFKDSRFNKLTNDKRAKVSSILTAISKAAQNQPKKTKTIGLETVDNDETTDSAFPSITVHTDVPNMTVESDQSVKDVRQYLVCCVFRNLNLEGQNFKKFINIQTNLHATLCDNRADGAIGTHEINSFVPPLRHLALPAENIHITALHKKIPISGKELLDALVRDAELARKRTKRSTLNPLHKYLHLVQQQPLLPCLTDDNGLVISLQPMTNSDLTKLSESTTSVFIEVSSSVSILKCKEVMDAIVMETVKICPELTIDQVRVSTGSDLVSIYPDKNDLPNMKIKRETYNE